METELERALRTAREWANDGPWPGAQVARAFLAQHARLAAVERERDEWMRLHAMECNARNAAESRLADAERRGAREALTRLADMQFGDDGWSKRVIQHWRDREYPAPSPVGGERECIYGCGGVNGHAAGCRAPDRPATPQAAPEPLEVVARSPLGSAFTLALTPADCQRIVETARAARPTGEG